MSGSSSYNPTRSPRPGLTPVASTSSLHSNPSSPLASPSSSTFSFSSAQTAHQYRSGSYSSFDTPNSIPSTASSSTARFHEALAGFPSKSRHAANPSTSSSSSSSSEAGFRFPPDSASPQGDGAFGRLQKELGGGPAGVVGLGFGGARDPSPRFGRSGLSDPEDRFHEEPESFDGYGGYEDTPLATPMEDEEFGFEEALRNAGYSSGMPSDASGMHGFGRPASMDMGADFGGIGGDLVEDGEAETSFDFLLSPPPSVSIEGGATLRGPVSVPPAPTGPDPTMTVRPLTSSTSSSNSTASDSTVAARGGFSPAGSASGTPKASRERTFPAPLLLGKDRPFGGVASPSTTAPLSLPRKSSVSTGSVAASPTPTRAAWAPSASMPPSSSSSSTDPIRPRDHHRVQHSSQSSITYTHSHNTSSASIASPTVGPSASFSSVTNLNGGSSSSSSSEPPIAPQALLLFVLSLRSASAPMALSQSQGPLSRSNTPLYSQSSNHQRIKSASSANANNSDDDADAVNAAAAAARLDTVDLSHKRIAEVPIEVIDELRDEVEKLALGYNLLRDLPNDFKVLGTRLRYLNVRVNMLTIFPAVLCDMPSLEILDISRNKIKKLPSVPGTLINLKVFSIAKNRVKRLPTYFGQMKHLKVLKIDHNPLEWPPKEISLFPTSSSSMAGSSASSVLGDGDSGRRSGGSKVEDAEEMQRWLPTLQKYVRDNAASQLERERRIPKRASFQLPSDDDPYTTNDERPEQGFTRSLGMARTESGRLITSPPTSGSTSRTRTTPPSTANGRTILDDDQALRGIHSRNASHSTTHTLENELRPNLKAKKSLPDLRQPHADILAERRTGGGTTDEERSKPALPTSAANARRPQQDRPAPQSRATLPNSASVPSSSTTPPLSSVASSTSPTPSSYRSHSQGNVTPKATPRRPLTPTTLSRGELEGPGMKRPDMDRSPTGFDRNSGAYFRRLSMLPASTISKTVPTTLLEFADAIRGILFSLSQIYAALRQFVVFASQDRLPAPLAKLMGSADGTTSLLINALDRFDSLSRRGTPSPAIVRNVFVTCRDNVVTFGKLVAALKPELTSFTATADVRYTRTLLLMLYGSTGEIAKSWNAVAPLLRDMDAPKEDEALATLVLHPPTPSPTNEAGSRGAPPAPAPVNGMFRTRSKTRRHAGSFSVEDVQLGAVLPPAPGVVPGSSSTAGQGMPDYPPYSGPSPISPTSIPTPTFDASTIKGRPMKSRPGAPGTIMLPSFPKDREGFVPNSWEQQLTPGGTGWLNIMENEAEKNAAAAAANANGNGNGNGGGSFFGRSSPNLGQQHHVGPTPLGSFSLPRNDDMRAVSTANADELFLNMVDPTTSIAFDVYAMVLDSFDDERSAVYDEHSGVILRELGPRRTKELTDICINGNEATVKLTGTLGRILGGDGYRAAANVSSAEAKRLGDDAYAFVQWVIRLGKMIKAMSLEHRFAPRIREGVGQLTIATKEFAKHLQATSFRPLVAPPSSSASAVTTVTSSSSRSGSMA